MPINRYDGILRRYNKDYVAATTNETLKFLVAHELGKSLASDYNAKILDIGCGEGDLTRNILEVNPKVHVHALDISSAMIASCKRHLADNLSRITFINQDIGKHLSKNPIYNYILASQVIHNFPQADKINTFKHIFDALTAGGKMIITEKIYLDNPATRNEMLNAQIKRYEYLPAIAAKAIIEHEKQDLSDNYRMTETETVNQLENIGFHDVRILDRIERDVILTASK